MGPFRMKRNYPNRKVQHSSTSVFVAWVAKVKAGLVNRKHPTQGAYFWNEGVWDGWSETVRLIKGLINRDPVDSANDHRRS